MPLTISNAPADHTWQASIELPDSGTTVEVSGCVNPSGIDGLTDVAMTGSPLTMPSTPSSGNTTYWIIEVNSTNGALDVQSNSTGFPIANSDGCVTIFQQTLTSSNSDPASDSTDVTPDA